METLADLLRWSESEYGIEHFCSSKKEKLPAVAMVTSGFDGPKDSIGMDEMFYFYACKNQTRVLVSNKDEDLFSIPLDCRIKFLHFSSRQKTLTSGKNLLKDIISMWTISADDTWIEAEGNQNLQYLVDATTTKSGKLGMLQVLETFELKYVLGLPIGNNISTLSVAIPDFLKIKVSHAVGTTYGDAKSFQLWMSKMQKITKGIDRSRYELHDEIIKFDKMKYISNTQHYQYLREACVPDTNIYEQLFPKATDEYSEVSLSSKILEAASLPLPRLPASQTARRTSHRIVGRPRDPTPETVDGNRPPFKGFINPPPPLKEIELRATSASNNRSTVGPVPLPRRTAHQTNGTNRIIRKPRAPTPEMVDKGYSSNEKSDNPNPNSRWRQSPVDSTA